MPPNEKLQSQKKQEPQPAYMEENELKFNQNKSHYEDNHFFSPVDSLQIIKSSEEQISFYKAQMSSFYQSQSIIDFVKILSLRSKELKENGIKLNQEINVSIRKVCSSASMKFIKFQVIVGLFTIDVTVSNHTDDTFDELVDQEGKLIGNGSEGQIYKLDFVKCAVKKICLRTVGNNNDCRQILFSRIFQYAMMKLASCFQIGPKIVQPFKFDIITSRNYLYFFIEECLPIHNLLTCRNNEEIELLYQKFETELKTSLFTLHSFQIIHYDIKPQNIMYSPSYQKFVFIDFGMAEFKNFGHCFSQKESFKGTYHYCSPEMRDLLTTGKDIIDVYYNDSYCLKKTIQIFKSNIQLFSKPQQHRQQNENQHFYEFHQQPNLTKSFQLFSSNLKLQLSQQEQQLSKSKEYALQNLSKHRKKSKNGCELPVSQQMELMFKLTFGLFCRQKESVLSLLNDYEEFICANLQEVTEIFFQTESSITESQTFRHLFHKHLQTVNIQKVFSLKNEHIFHRFQTPKNPSKLPSQSNSVTSPLIIQQNYPNIYPLYLKYYRQASLSLKFLLQRYSFVKCSKFDLKIILKNTYSMICLSEVQELQQQVDSRQYTLYLIYDYVTYLFDWLVQNNGVDYELYVFAFFQKLSQHIPFFNVSKPKLQQHPDINQLLKIIKESLEHIFAILSDDRLFDKLKEKRMMTSEKYLIEILNPLKMVAIVLYSGCLEQSIMQLQEERLQSMLKFRFNLILTQLQNFSNETPKTCKQVILKMQVASFGIQFGFIKLLYEHLIQTIIKLNENDQHTVRQHIMKGKRLITDIIDFDSKMMEAIKRLDVKSLVKSDTKGRACFFLKRITEKQISHSENGQYSQLLIGLFLRFSEFAEVKFSEGCNFAHLQQKSEQIAKYMGSYNYQNHPLVLRDMNEHFHATETIFMICVQQLMKEGHIYKPIQNIQAHLQERRQFYRKNQKQCWEIQMRVCDMLDNLYVKIGEREKRKRLSRRVKEIKHRYLWIQDNPTGIKQTNQHEPKEWIFSKQEIGKVRYKAKQLDNSYSSDISLSEQQPKHTKIKSNRDINASEDKLDLHLNYLKQLNSTKYNQVTRSSEEQQRFRANTTKKEDEINAQGNSSQRNRWISAKLTYQSGQQTLLLLLTGLRGWIQEGVLLENIFFNRQSIKTTLEFVIALLRSNCLIQAVRIAEFMAQSLMAKEAGEVPFNRLEKVYVKQLIIGAFEYGCQKQLFNHVKRIIKSCIEGSQVKSRGNTHQNDQSQIQKLLSSRIYNKNQSTNADQLFLAFLISKQCILHLLDFIDHNQVSVILIVQWISIMRKCILLLDRDTQNNQFYPQHNKKINEIVLKKREVIQILFKVGQLLMAHKDNSQETMPLRSFTAIVGNFNRQAGFINSQSFSQSNIQGENANYVSQNNDSKDIRQMRSYLQCKFLHMRTIIARSHGTCIVSKISFFPKTNKRDQLKEQKIIDKWIRLKENVS